MHAVAHAIAQQPLITYFDRASQPADSAKVARARRRAPEPGQEAIRAEAGRMLRDLGNLQQISRGLGRSRILRGT